MNNDHTETPKADSAPDVAAGTSSSVESRRRFIRASAVSGAVLLTLHNRAAWGGEPKKPKEVCVSENVWTSYTAGVPSAVDRHKDDKEVQAFQAAMNDPSYKKPAVPGDVAGQICLKKKK